MSPPHLEHSKSPLPIGDCLAGPVILFLVEVGCQPPLTLLKKKLRVYLKTSRRWFPECGGFIETFFINVFQLDLSIPNLNSAIHQPCLVHHTKFQLRFLLTYRNLGWFHAPFLAQPGIFSYPTSGPNRSTNPRPERSNSSNFPKPGSSWRQEAPCADRRAKWNPGWFNLSGSE